MFSYQLNCDDLKCVTKMTESNITFEPPVFEQRYWAAIQIVKDKRWVDNIKKVVEFGCAEMRFFPLLRRVETIEQILQVDIDEATLKKYLIRTKPLISDYIRQRLTPLRVDVLLGNVADSADELRDTDAVIALELIEHVHDDELAKIPSNIFGFMQPKLAILSTPNADYNVIFKNFHKLRENGLRHHDHKFEWTRKEFETWCLSITAKYQNYRVSFTGVGDAPPGYQSIGHVSQIGIFVRKDMLNMQLLSTKPAVDICNLSTYKSLYLVNYPYYKETRTKKEIIWDEAQFEMSRCLRTDDNYDNEKHAYKMSINKLFSLIESKGATISMLNELLYENNINVENGYVFMDESENDDDDDDDDVDDDVNENCTTNLNLAEFSHTFEAETEENWDA